MTTQSVIRIEKYFEPHPGDPPTPFGGQRGPYFTDAHTIALKWARRAGKGRVACFKLIDTYLKLAESPRPMHLVPSFHAMFVAPFRRNADQAWMDLLAFMPDELKLNVVNDERKLWLQPYGSLTSALIEFRTGDNPTGLQGVGLDFLWLTEAQDLTPEAYALVSPARHSFEREGILFAEGIPPRDPDHFFNSLYEDGIAGVPDHFASKLTYLENPMATAAARRDILKDRDDMLDSEWRRMYLAEDPTEFGLPMDIDPCLADAIVWDDQRPQEGRTYVGGLDLGQEISATVLTIWDTTSYPWRLRYFKRMEGTNWVVQENVLVDAIKLWNPAHVNIDDQGPGSPMRDRLRFRGVKLRPIKIQTNRAASSREDLLTKLALIFEKRWVRIPKEPVIIREVRAMRHVKISQLTQRWQVRRGLMDDCVFSMALGVHDMTIRDSGRRTRKKVGYY